MLFPRMSLPALMLAIIVLAFGMSAPESAPVSAGSSDEYFIYSSFDPPGIDDVVAAGGYVEYYGVPQWGDEIQYVYFLSGTVGYKVRVWVTDGDGDGVIEPRQHPSHYLSAYQGPVEPRHFEIVSSGDLSGYTGGSGNHAEEFYVDSSGVYFGAYPYGIHKWDHDWNYLGQVANRPPGGTESLAYNPAENVWYAGGRYRTIYELSDTNSDGSFLDESWVAIFTYPSYGGDHHDGLEYVGGYLWISDMTSDVIGKWQYDPASGTWVELKRFTYSEAADVEGMGFGPNDHFWCGSGWGSDSYIYELGNEITRGYPIANAGLDVDAHPPTIPIEFDASGSHHTDVEKEIVLYEWDFESDGTWDYSGTDLVVEHTYPAYYNPDGSIDWDKTAKDYTATLRVTDNSDPPLQDTDTRIVHITAPPWKPVADADGPYEGSIGTPITLDASGSFDPESIMFPPDHPWYETIATYEWDLDYDGEFDDSTDIGPMWTCDSEGVYIVGLRVTDSQASGPGGSIGPLDVAVDYASVVIEESPDSDGDGVPDDSDLCPATAPGATVDANGCSDAQVDADGDGICDPGAPSGGPSDCTGSDDCPSEPEDFDGFRDEDGCPDFAPEALFDCEPDNPLPGDVFVCDASASYDPDGGTIENYRWEFYRLTIYLPFPLVWLVEGPDKTIVEHSFVQEGDYEVRLTVTDDEGEAAVGTAYLTVRGIISPLRVQWAAPAEARLGENFDITLEVYNSASITQPVSFSLSTVVRTTSGDFCGPPPVGCWDPGYVRQLSLDGAPYTEGTTVMREVPPAATVTYVFTVNEKWNWIEPWNWTRFVDVVGGILVSWPKMEIASLTYTAVMTLFNYVPHVGNVTYGYEGVADSQHSSWKVDVSVPWEKQVLYWESVAAGIVGSKATAAGWVMLFLPIPGARAAAAALFAVEAVEIVVGEIAYAAAADPEENYTELAVQHPIPVPETCGVDDPGARQIARAALNHLASIQALQVTYARHDTAQAAGDADWSAVQTSLTYRYAQRAAQAARDLSDLIGPALDGVPTPTGEELERIRGQIGDEGLPDVEECMLSTLGYTAEEIDQVQDAIVNPPDEAFQYFPDLPEALDVWAANMGVFSDALPSEAEALTPLVTGWNQACYVGDEEPIDRALAGIAGDVQAVYRLSPQQTFDRWFPGKPEVSNIDTLVPGDSLFVLASHTTAWAQDASGSLPASASLVQGWNSVCYTGPTKNAEAATGDIAGGFAVAYALRPDQTWERFVPGRDDISNLAFVDSSSTLLVSVTREGGTQWVFDS